MQPNDEFLIGKRIEEVLRSQERGVAWLARKINCTPGNIYKMFEKQSIDTQLLFRLSQVLQHDFFADLSTKLRETSQE